MGANLRGAVRTGGPGEGFESSFRFGHHPLREGPVLLDVRSPPYKKLSALRMQGHLRMILRPASSAS